MGVAEIIILCSTVFQGICLLGIILCGILSIKKEISPFIPLFLGIMAIVVGNLGFAISAMFLN